MNRPLNFGNKKMKIHCKVPTELRVAKMGSSRRNFKTIFKKNCFVLGRIVNIYYKSFHFEKSENPVTISHARDRNILHYTLNLIRLFKIVIRIFT